MSALVIVAFIFVVLVATVPSPVCRCSEQRKREAGELFDCCTGQYRGWC